jgi:hypothetical protein
LCRHPGESRGPSIQHLGSGALDKWVRDNTVNRFGPVREVRPGLVLEIAFDSVHRSTRHKSGIAMRFPRVPHPLGQAHRRGGYRRGAGGAHRVTGGQLGDIFAP